MKKFLLSLTLFLGLAPIAFAEDTTAEFDFTDCTKYGYEKPETGEKSGSGIAITEGEAITSGNVTITVNFNGQTGNSQFRFFEGEGKSTTDFRVSSGGGKKGQTLTFATTDGKNISSIEFTASKLALTDGTTTLSTSNKTWTGNAASVVLTSTEANTITKVVVTTIEASNDYIAAPSFSLAAGTYYGTQTVALTHADSDAKIYYTVDGTEPTAASTEYTAAISVDKDMTIKAIAVKGSITSEVASAEYVIKELNTITTIAAVIEAGKGEYIINMPLTVGYATTGAAFVTDGTDFIQIYDSKYKLTYKQGDQLATGWQAEYSLYGSTPELMPKEYPTATEGSFTAKEYAASEITTALVNHVLVIKDLTFEEATPSTKSNFTGTNGETSITVRNNYTLASVEAGTYDVTGVVAIYNNAVQFYPIEYTASTSSVNSVVVDSENAPVEYFNLQGVRVANPTQGLYIVRQGNKVSKQVIR